MYNDLITCPDAVLKFIGKENYQAIEKFRNVSFEDALADKDLERTFVQGKFGWNVCHELQKEDIFSLWKVSKHAFADKCEPSLLISRNVGNMYTPSLYGHGFLTSNLNFKFDSTERWDNVKKIASKSL